MEEYAKLEVTNGAEGSVEISLNGEVVSSIQLGQNWVDNMGALGSFPDILKSIFSLKAEGYKGIEIYRTDLTDTIDF